MNWRGMVKIFFILFGYLFCSVYFWGMLHKFNLGEKNLAIRFAQDSFLVFLCSNKIHLAQV